MTKSQLETAGMQISSRKLEHIKIVSEANVEPVPSPYTKYKLPWKAMPEIDMAEIDTTVEFLGRKLSFPFFVGSMTGGPEEAAQINMNLALACEQEKIGLAMGSMRVILRDPQALKSFQVRKFCPSIPLFTNLGLVQLNYGFGADEINKLLDLSEADGIFLHVNHLQEAMQPEGDTNFKDLFSKLEKLLPKIHKPVIIKEVGSGIDAATVQRFKDIGIEWVDVSGLGGTSWTIVEALRRKDNLGLQFGDVGIATDEALLAARKITGINLIAGSGIRSGIDIAKAIMLGADLTSAAKPLLAPAMATPEACIAVIQKFKKELIIAMFCGGFKNVAELKKVKLLLNQ
jgi:isopentenyl-diphosphate delta-isomerase